MFSLPLASPTLSVVMATATDTETDVLGQLDFDVEYDEVVPCVFDERNGFAGMHCDRPAVVLLQVCSGKVYALCEGHLLWSRRTRDPLICNRTSRWERWESHFRIVRWLR